MCEVEQVYNNVSQRSVCCISVINDVIDELLALTATDMSCTLPNQFINLFDQQWCRKRYGR